MIKLHWLWHVGRTHISPDWRYGSHIWHFLIKMQAYRTNVRCARRQAVPVGEGRGGCSLISGHHYPSSLSQEWNELGNDEWPSPVRHSSAHLSPSPFPSFWFFFCYKLDILKMSPRVLKKPPKGWGLEDKNSFIFMEVILLFKLLVCMHAHTQYPQ